MPPRLLPPPLRCLALSVLSIGLLTPLILMIAIPEPEQPLPARPPRPPPPPPPPLRVGARGGSDRGAAADASPASPAEEAPPPPHPHGVPVWAFMYLWYGNPELDGRYWHWTHPVLPHWDPRVAARYPRGTIEAPGRVASPGGARPARGLYSSRDPAVLSDQMSELRGAGAEGCIVSWWGRDGGRDDNGPPTEPERMRAAFDAAEASGMKISVHLEPYRGRTAGSVCDDLSFLLDTYGSSPAWDPRVYVYDAYLTPARDWGGLSSDCPARGRVRLVSLILAPDDVAGFASDGKFDGVYTYFAAAGFTAASRPSSWPAIAAAAEGRGMFFVPCIGPGYDDTAIRPWNEANRRERKRGTYFRKMWESVPRDVRSVELVAVTSYNEWAEGTMIEPTEEDGGMYMDILKGFKW